MVRERWVKRVHLDLLLLMRVFHVCLTCLSSRTCSHPNKITKGSGLGARRPGLKGIPLFECVYDIKLTQAVDFQKQTWKRHEISFMPRSNPPSPPSSCFHGYCSCQILQVVMWNNTKFDLTSFPHKRHLSFLNECCASSSTYEYDQIGSQRCACSDHNL